jgi:eukaryotic-like serine/threonine-protein kinase
MLSHRAMGCLDDETALAFFERTLAAAVATEVEAHADQCPACRTLIANLARVWTAEDALLATVADVQPSDTAAKTQFVAAGTALGRYIVADCIGEGGMGQVYRAYDPDLDRTVALKLLRPAVLPADVSEPAHARLTREAKAMARISHPNVLPVYDVNVADGRVFFAMELIAGTTLRGLALTRPDWRATITAYVSAGRGLVAAHQRGIIHRDFKPDNVLVGNDGRILVTDFGIARREETAIASSEPASDPRALSAITKTGSVIGTPAYMAPEQRTGAAVTAKSDQYSFCVALAEALLGHRPQYPADIDIEATSATPLPVLLALRTGLAQAPEARHASMDDLLALLTSACAPATAAVQRQARSRAVGVAAALTFAASLGTYMYITRDLTATPRTQLAQRDAVAASSTVIVTLPAAPEQTTQEAVASNALTPFNGESRARTIAPTMRAMNAPHPVYAVPTTEPTTVPKPRAIVHANTANTASVPSNEDL